MSAIPTGFPLPKEMIVSFFPFLTPSALVRFQATCSRYKNLVDNDLASQLRFDEYRLRTYAKIPLRNLQYFFVPDRFAIQIQGDFNLHHLTHDLAPTLSRVSHLIVKDCISNPPILENLFKRLAQNNQLSALYLFKCNLNEPSSKALDEILENTRKQKDFKIYYSKTEEKPLQVTTSSSAFEILPEEDGRFDIENLEPGDNTLDAFVQEVSNEEVPASSVLAALDTLKSTIKMEVIKSIWNSLLVDLQKSTPDAEYITQETRLYIEKHPHHPGIIAAAETSKERYAKHCISS